jgi:hypothetical protein
LQGFTVWVNPIAGGLEPRDSRQIEWKKFLKELVSTAFDTIEIVENPISKSKFFKNLKEGKSLLELGGKIYDKLS